MLITNYITSAWRNILRHKLFSIINIMGLAIGLAAVMLIALYVRYETSYDSFWKNADNIYRLHYHMAPFGQKPGDYVAAPPSVKDAIKRDFPEIEFAARFAMINRPIEYKGDVFQESLRLADPEFIKIFDFKVLEGDLSAAINDNSSIIFTRKTAEKYFGKTDPLGQIVTINQGPFVRDYKVGAIIDDIPENSILKITTLLGLFEDDWKDIHYLQDWFQPYFIHTYFSLMPDTDISDRFVDFIDRVFPPIPNGDTSRKTSDAISFSYMNVKDLHLKAVGEFEIGVTNGALASDDDYTSVILFSVIAMLILIIASINFINLSTARAGSRAKEVSLRKTVGASRNNLIFQFIGESVFLSVIALLVSLCLVEFSLPYYSDFVKEPLALNYNFTTLGFMVAITLFVGILGGVYPAYILSSFHPSQHLRSNKSVDNDRTIGLRTTLVILQFTISIALFVSTAAIYSQFYYIQNWDFGYNNKNLLSIWGGTNKLFNERKNILIDRLKKLPQVANVTTTSNFSPGYADPSADPLRTENMDSSNPIMINERSVGYDFFKTYEIPVIAGRTFAEGRNDERDKTEKVLNGTAYTASVILNYSAMQKLGFSSPKESIDKKIYVNYGKHEDGSKIEGPFKIIGVIPDIHLQSLKEKTPAEYYRIDTKFAFYITMRYRGSSTELLSKVRQIWKEEIPSAAFNPIFSEETMARNYPQEQNQMIMFAAFSGLAIFIACLGLFGLASFTAERRTKEIGIRKVFGAEVWQIVKLLVWQFSKPVLIANIIAWPIAYLAMSRWLESFVYRIDDMVIIALCLVAGLTALLIAWATVAGNSYAVARQNPIKALRYE
ncbi:MAG: ABC transporter permease [Kordiimonadaceae bacterium]|nr:ABC transporter permease [Kordiimonadaceae bacterium]